MEFGKITLENETLLLTIRVRIFSVRLTFSYRLTTASFYTLYCVQLT